MKKFSNKDAIEKLEKLKQQIDIVKKRKRFSPDFKKWQRDVKVAISYIFGEKSKHLKEFGNIRYSLMTSSSSTPDSEWEKAFQKGLDDANAILDSMIQEIQDYWDKDISENYIKVEESLKTVEKKLIVKDIFIVHGHDEGLKETIARFISKIGLNPIILHEKPNIGRTIIEKFQDYSSVSYAIAILTPDDFGGSNTNPDEKHMRARQNVIFELGFFIGKLGRERVTALYKENIEMPSDYSGVIYIPIDRYESWKLSLIKELKSAGFDVDANLALS